MFYSFQFIREKPRLDIVYLVLVISVHIVQLSIWQHIKHNLCFINVLHHCVAYNLLFMADFTMKFAVINFDRFT